MREATKELASLGIIARSFRVSKRRPQNPRRELFIADSRQFALRSFPVRDGNNLFEDAHSNLFDSFGAVEDRAGVDIHVVLHPLVEWRVGGDLDAWRRLAAVNAAAASREHAD